MDTHARPWDIFRAMLREGQSRALPIALLIALGLHGALTFVSLHDSTPRDLPKRSPVEIDLLEMPVETPGAKSDKSTRDSHQSSSMMRSRAKAPRAIHSDVVVEPDGDSFVVGKASGPPGLGDGAKAEGEDRHRKIDLGLDGPLPYLFMDNSPRRYNLPEQQRDVGGLKQGLLDRDVDRGVSRGGIVVQIGRGIVVDVGPSEESSATLSITFGKKGEVTSVSVQTASSHSQDWSRVSEALTEALARRALPTLAAPNGYRIVVQLETRNRLPSGTKPGEPKIERKTWLTIDGKFDVADIGQKPRRTVFARIVSEEYL